MYICVITSRIVCINKCMYTSMKADMSVCLYLRTYNKLCMYVCIYICMYVYVCFYICMCFHHAADIFDSIVGI